MNLLDCEGLENPANGELKTHEDVARHAARALRSLCVGGENQRATARAGALPLLAQLLDSQDEVTQTAVAGILQECSDRVGLVV